MEGDVEEFGVFDELFARSFAPPYSRPVFPNQLVVSVDSP